MCGNFSYYDDYDYYYPNYSSGYGCGNNYGMNYLMGNCYVNKHTDFKKCHCYKKKYGFGRDYVAYELHNKHGKHHHRMNKHNKKMHILMPKF